jgi:hypothetical protein
MLHGHIHLRILTVYYITGGTVKFVKGGSIKLERDFQIDLAHLINEKQDW